MTYTTELLDEAPRSTSRVGGRRHGKQADRPRRSGRNRASEAEVSKVQPGEGKTNSMAVGSQDATDNGSSSTGDWLNTIHWGDCLDVMRTLPDDSVDLIVTSPPYADARKHTYGGIPPCQYVDWFCERAREMRRILTPSGSFVLNIKEKAVDGERHTYVLELILALKREVGLRWVEEYVWHKTTAAPGKWKYRFRDSWERLLHFSKTRDVKMNQDAVKVPIGDWTAKRLVNMSKNDRSRQESATRSNVGRCIANWENKATVYPSNVLHRSPIAHNTGHSAAFPEWLPEFFIQLFTDEGDVVLDPFLGSGTTFRVAKQLNRIPVGIELNRQTPIDVDQDGHHLD